MTAARKLDDRPALTVAEVAQRLGSPRSRARATRCAEPRARNRPQKRREKSKKWSSLLALVNQRAQYPSRRSARSAATNGRATMNSLNGTDKQIEWANDLRAKFLAAHPSIADLAADVFADATQWINARHDLSAVAGVVFGALLAAGRDQDIIARLAAECRADLARAIVTENDGSRRIPRPTRVIGDVIGWAGALRSLRSSAQENRLWILVGANADVFLGAILAPIDGLEHDPSARSEAEDMIRDAVALATRPAPARRAR